MPQTVASPTYADDDVLRHTEEDQRTPTYHPQQGDHDNHNHHINSNSEGTTNVTATGNSVIGVVAEQEEGIEGDDASSVDLRPTSILHPDQHHYGGTLGGEGEDDDLEEEVGTPLTLPNTTQRGNMFAPQPLTHQSHRHHRKRAAINNDSICSLTSQPSPSNASTATAHPGSRASGVRPSPPRRMMHHSHHHHHMVDLSEDGTSPFHRMGYEGSGHRRGLSGSSAMPPDDDTSSLTTIHPSMSGPNSTAAANSDIGFGSRPPRYHHSYNASPGGSQEPAPLSPREQLRNRNLMVEVSTDGTRGGSRGGFRSPGSPSPPMTTLRPLSPHTTTRNNSNINKRLRWSPTWKNDRGGGGGGGGRASSPTVPLAAGGSVSPPLVSSIAAAPHQYNINMPVCGSVGGSPLPVDGGSASSPLGATTSPPSNQRSAANRPISYRRLVTIWQVITPTEFRVFIIVLLIYWILMILDFLGGMVTAAVLSPNMLGEVGNQCNKYVPIAFVILLVLIAFTIVALAISGAIMYVKERPMLAKGRRMSPPAIFSLTIMSLLLLSIVSVSFYSLFIARDDDTAQRRSCGVVFEGLRATAITTVILGLGGVFAYMVFYTFLTRRLHESWTRETRV